MSPKASGSAAGNVRVPLSAPFIGKKEEQAVLRVLRSGRLVQGPEVEAFEAEFAGATGFEHAVAVSSGSAALLLSLKALSVGPGDEVVIPAYTFIATANAARLAGAEVVLADVSPRTLNLDPESVALAAGPGTAVVIPVHQFGLLADVEGISAAAPRAVILEDAACAAGACTAERSVGRVTCFSFHSRKAMTTGEGGMVTTSDSGLARRLRRLRQHGMDEKGAEEAGYNFRMNEMAAALGRVQLKRLPGLLEKRRQAAERYAEDLKDLDWLILPESPDTPAHDFQSYVVRLSKDAPVSREQVIERLRSAGIECQAGVQPVHRHKAYQNTARIPLPVSEQAGNTAFFLPMHARLGPDDVGRVCRSLRSLTS
jgi:dTDP-4-amino-4,6-dideoxygalactose transaminase